MQGNPERPYAQLLAPAAKSQKLLLRLQHKKLLPPAQLVRAQLVFAVWQKLLAKNIPSTPWPEFADLLLFPDGEYIALLLHPFANRQSVQAASAFRHLDGYLLLDQRASASLLSISSGHLVVSLQLVDRLSARAWQGLSRELPPWQASLVPLLDVLDADAALDLLAWLRQQAAAPWDGLPLPHGLAEAVPVVYFALWRARGGAVSRDKLTGVAIAAPAALSWLVAVGLVEVDQERYRLRRG